MDKRGILLIVSLILVLGALQLVGASHNPDLYNATVTNVSRLGALSAVPRFLTEYRTGFHLNVTGGNVGAFPGHQYQLNITINNSIGGLNDIFNVTTINVTLPAALRFVNTSNGSIAWINNVNGAPTLLRFTNSTNGSDQQVLTWNGTLLMNRTVALQGRAATISFNVTVQSGVTEGAQDIAVNLIYDKGEGGDVGRIMGGNYSIHNNITIDTTAPSLNKARTNNTLNAVNVSFSELVNATSILTATAGTCGFNVTNVSRSGVTQVNVTSIVREGEAAAEAISFALALDTNYLTNSTPLIHINRTSCVTDRAGNILSNTLGINAATANITALDAAQPHVNISGINYNHFTRQLILGFNETVDPGNLVLGQINITGTDGNGAKFGNPIYSLPINSSATVSVMDNATLIITLTQTDADKISSFRLGLLNISVNTTAITDMSGNKVLNDSERGADPGANRSVQIYVNDTESGNISSITFDEHTGFLTITFNETVDTSSAINLTNIELWNQSSPVNAEKTRLAGLFKNNVAARSNSTVLTINLTQAQLDNVSIMVKGDDTPTIYVVLNNSNTTLSLGANIKDVGGNLIISPSANQTSIGTFTIKQSPPTIINFSVNSTFGRPTNPYVKAGITILNLSFNDSMASNQTGTVNVTTASGTVVSATGCYWFNTTMLSCNVTFTTSSGDGIANINVSNLQLANRITKMNNNATNTFRIDTVVPVLLRAVYDDLNPSSMNFTGDSVLLQFSENITFVASAGTASEVPIAQVGVDGVNFNLTVEIDTFNDTSDDTGYLGLMVSNATVLGVANNSFINITLNRTTNITIRGRYSETAQLRGNASGINVVAGQVIVSDYAGNYVTYNGRHDIADEMLVFEANLLNYFSVPFCVDTTALDNQTDHYSGYIRTFTQSAYRTVSDGLLSPLYGYELNLTKDVALVITTKKQSECGLVDHVISLNQNYTMLGVDNNTAANATHLFASLGSGSQVSNLYPDPKSLGTIETTVAQYNARAFNAYSAYWIFPGFDTASKNFNGLGII